jgi:hypothetical protein
MTEPELCKSLGLDRDGLHQLANSARLPYSVTTSLGMMVRAEELPAWQCAARAWRGCCGD